MLEEPLTEPCFESLPPKPPLVFMRFRPAWTYIDGIRDFGEFFCRTTFADPEVAARACIVIQETLENAIKYSQHDTSDELELMISTSRTKIEFSVTSPPERLHLDKLRAELELLNRTDPEQAFLAALERAQRQPEESARIGLARMRYEGEVELTLHDAPDGRIRFTARGKL
jgi:hypothetical protein